jgi:C1A family cysteine protease
MNREYGKHIVLNHTKSNSQDHIATFESLPKLMADKYVKFPDKFSLSSRFSLTPLDQGSLGSCVANSFAAIIKSLHNIMPSRLYYYFNARVASGTSPTNDSGLYLLQAYPIFKSFGIVPESNWKYITTNFSKMPPYSLTYKVANTVIPCTISSVAQNDAAIKAALYSNNFIIFGLYVYSSFMTNAVASTGIIPMPNTQTESLQGGHCIHIVGWTTYNNTPYYIIQNSWSTGWGNNGAVTAATVPFKNNGKNGGFAYIPTAYVLNPSLAFELLAVT